MRIIFLLLAAGLTLAGCSTTKGYQQKLDCWLGADEKSLLESNWGIPDKTLREVDGNTIYCYKNRRIISTPTKIYTNSHGNMTIFSGIIHEKTCQTCFYINQDLIIYHYTFKGDDCLAREQH